MKSKKITSLEGLTIDHKESYKVYGSLGACVLTIEELTICNVNEIDTQMLMYKGKVLNFTVADLENEMFKYYLTDSHTAMFSDYLIEKGKAYVIKNVETLIKRYGASNTRSKRAINASVEYKYLKAHGLLPTVLELVKNDMVSLTAHRVDKNNLTLQELERYMLCGYITINQLNWDRAPQGFTFWSRHKQKIASIAIRTMRDLVEMGYTLL